MPAALRYAAERGLIEGDLADVADATYFLSTITIDPTEDPGMARWRQKIFVALARNSANPAAYFRLPDDRTISIGARVQL